MSTPQTPSGATFLFQLPPDISAQLDVQFVPNQYYVGAIEQVQPSDETIDLAVWLLVSCNKGAGVANSSLYYIEWIQPGTPLMVRMTEYVAVSRLEDGAYVLREERQVPTDSKLAEQLEVSVREAGFFTR